MTVHSKLTCILSPSSLFVFVLSLLLGIQAAVAAPVSAKAYWYPSSITRDGKQGIKLYAELNYDSSRTGAPIAVVMHGYNGNATEVRANAQRLRDQGFFAISVAMRGRNGSGGTRDIGGLEIYDIYDAVENVKADYAGLVDPTNVYITGYSGGGGNVMSALTKFPDYFRAGSAFFGTSDYGYDVTNGFWGTSPGDQPQLTAEIGDRIGGNPAVVDRYMARASNLASKNNPYSEIHLFVNDDEDRCAPVHNTSYRANALAAASFEGEFDNIHVHIGSTTNPQYNDFNSNGKNEANEKQSWPHGYPTSEQQHAAEAWFLKRLLRGAIARPQLNAADELFVAGYVKTRPFTFWLGDGQNAAGALSYRLAPHCKTFRLDVLSNNKDITGWLEVDTRDMVGTRVHVLLNGTRKDEFTGGSLYRFNNLGHSDTLTLTNDHSSWNSL